MNERASELRAVTVRLEGAEKAQRIMDDYDTAAHVPYAYRRATTYLPPHYRRTFRSR